jgi:hypothetical protein
MRLRVLTVTSSNWSPGQPYKPSPGYKPWQPPKNNWKAPWKKKEPLTPRQEFRAWVFKDDARIFVRAIVDGRVTTTALYALWAKDRDQYNQIEAALWEEFGRFNKKPHEVLGPVAWTSERLTDVD